MTTSSINLASLQSSQGFSIYGAVSGLSGASVSSAGDVNGDGYDDIIIGAPDANSYSGVSYVIYGGVSIDPTVYLINIALYGFSITGANINDKSGASVSGAGDINGDGYDDIIIGAPGANSQTGISYVIYGGAYLPNIDLMHLEYWQGFSIIGIASSASGVSVSKVGDVNGDGYDDIIIGAPYANAMSGLSYIIYGNATLPSTINLEVLGTQGVIILGTYDSVSGLSVSGAGDINKDGYFDVIVGAPGASGYYAAYVIYGGSSLPSTISLISLGIQGISIMTPPVDPEESGGYNNVAVSNAGDVNGDGYDDVIIGISYINYYAGESYLVYGSASLPTTISLVSIGNQGISIAGATVDEGDYDYSGYSVASAGDVNNDGYDDIIIGAYGTNYNTGKSYLVYGGSSLPSSINLTELTAVQGFSIYGAGSYSNSGLSVSGAGDLNNDTYDDILIGAPSTTYANSFTGESFVIYGAASGFVTSSPTSFPTITPLTVLQWWETSEFQKSASSIGGSILTFVAGWILREKIAFYVLNNWGHEYKFIYKNSYVSLKENEVGLRLNDNELKCIIKSTEYSLSIDDSGHNGISKGLHDLIIQALENPVISQSFTLIQSEKNQIRDYLITHKFLEPKTTFCFLKGYTELGYIKGTSYNLFLGQFEVEHTRACKKKARSDSIVEQHSIDKLSVSSCIDSSGDCSSSNPIISTLSTQQQLQWDVKKSDRTSYIDDIETSVDEGNILEINRQDTKSLNNHNQSPKKGCVLMSIDAMMDPEHVRLQDKEFAKFGNQLTYIENEATDSYSKLLTIENSISASSNIDYSSAALFTQQALEYAPTIRYFFKVFGVDLPQVHLPNELWTGMHFAAGVVKINADNNLVLGQTLESFSYYARLTISDELAKNPSDEKPTDIISFAQTCGKHIAVGGVLGLVSSNPIYGTINGAAICLNHHHMLEESTTQTAVRYAVDAVVGVMAVYGLADQNILVQAIGVVSAISMSDIVSRVGIATVELGMNGVSNWFEMGDYEYI